MKRCSNCKESFVIDKFYKNKSTKDGYASECKVCKNAYRKKYIPQYLERNRCELTGLRLTAQKALLKTYGITFKQYKELFNQQAGLCCICKNPPSDKFALCVDHDHSTGRVRGLLCGECNFGLGKFKDNPTLLLEAVKYLLMRGKHAK